MSKLARSFILINLSEIAFVFSGYFIHAYLGRLLNPADYGRYGLIITLATMTIVFIGDGIPKALAKYIAQFPEKEKVIKRKAAVAQSLVVGLISLIYYFGAPYLARYFFRDDSLTASIQLSTLIIPAFAAASFYNNYFNGLHLFGMQAAQRAIRAVARILAILVLAYFLGIEGAIIGYVIAPLIVSVFSFLVDKNKHKPLVGNFPYKDLLTFGFGIISFMMAYNLVINIDLFLTKRILEDDYLVGIYNSVITVGRIPFYFFSNLAFILLPTISKIFGKRPAEEVQDLIRDSMRYVILLIVPSVAGIVLFSKEVITLLYSAKYIEGDLALKFFVVGIGALTLFYIATFILNGSGKVHLSATLTWIGFGVNTLLNLFLIPRFGIVGSAIATASTSFVLMAFSLYLISHQFGQCINWRSFLKTGLITLLVSAAFYFVPKSVPLLIPEVILFFLVYFGLLSLFGEMKKEDLERLRQTFTRKKKRAIVES